MKITAEDTTVYTTKDGSEIRELLHPDNNTNVNNQSLAQARVCCGKKTSPHFHKLTEEIYYISEGEGRMYLEAETFDVKKGDSILIRPGQVHCIENTGSVELVFLCCCSPAYQHKDTYLV